MPGLGLLGCFCQYSGTDNQSCASPVSATSGQLYRTLVFAAQQRVGEFLKEVPPPLALSYLPVAPVFLYVYSLRYEPSSQVSKHPRLYAATSRSIAASA
jgi:hypothetical protein